MSMILRETVKWQVCGEMIVKKDLNGKYVNYIVWYLTL